jgi:hypothetical protein
VARGVISVGEVETGILATALETGILVAGLETVDDCAFIESLCFLIASVALPYKFEACVVNVSHNVGELVFVVEEFIIITIQ